MNKNDFQEWLNNGGRSTTKSADFGQLQENQVYNMEILSVEEKANNSFLLKAKTISGPTGKGTFVSAFYSDGTPNPDLEDRLKGFNYTMADKLLLAGGIDAGDVSNVAKTLKEQLDAFRATAVGTKFSAKVKANGEYWNIDKFSVAPEADNIVDAPKPTAGVDIKDMTDFGF